MKFVDDDDDDDVWLSVLTNDLELSRCYDIYAPVILTGLLQVISIGK